MLTPTTGPIALALLTAVIVLVCYLRADRDDIDTTATAEFDTTTPTRVADLPAGEDDTDTDAALAA